MVLVVDARVRRSLGRVAEGGRRVGGDPRPVDLQRLAARGRLPRPGASVKADRAANLDRRLGARRPALREVAPIHRAAAGRARDRHVADVAAADAAVRRRRIGIAEVRETGAVRRLRRPGAVLAALPGHECRARPIDGDLRLVLALRRLPRVGAHRGREAGLRRRAARCSGSGDHNQHAQRGEREERGPHAQPSSPACLL